MTDFNLNIQINALPGNHASTVTRLIKNLLNDSPYFTAAELHAKPKELGIIYHEPNKPSNKNHV